MKSRSVTSTDVVNALKRGPLTIMELAEKLGCLTKPMPNSMIRHAMWEAIGEHQVKMDQNNILSLPDQS